MKKNKNIYVLVFIATLLIIPFIYSKSIVDPTLLSRQILIAIFVAISAVLLFLFLPQKPTPIKLGSTHISMLLLVGCSVLSIYNAHNISEAYYACGKLLLSATVFLVVYFMVINKCFDLLFISRFFIAYVLIIVSYQCYEIFSLNGFDLLQSKKLYKLQTLFGHKNLFSSMAFLCVPFLLYSIIHDKKIIKTIACVLLIVLVTLLVFIQTKAVLLAIVVGFICCIPMFINVLKQVNKKTYNISLILTGTLFLAILIIAFLYKNKLNLLSNNDTVKERILLWINTWEMIKEHPISGVGAGNWQIFFPKYGLQNFIQTNYSVSDGYTTFQRPHNDFLWLCSELGIFALVAYLLLFSSVLRCCYILFIKHTSIKHKLTYTVFFFAIVGYIFIALVDFPMERCEHQFIIFTILAIVVGLYDVRKNDANKNVQSNKYLHKIILTLCFIIAFVNIYICYIRYGSEQHERKLLLAHSTGNWDVMISEAKLAENKLSNIDNFSIPYAWYSGVAKFAQGNLSEARKDFERAYNINPYQIHVLNNLASCYEKSGKHERAFQLYDEALAISPHQPDALLNKSGALFNAGNVQDAFSTIIKFKFDENNEQFKTFFLTIVKAKINEDLYEQNKNVLLRNKVLETLKNDKLLLNKFSLSQQNNTNFEQAINP